MDGLLMSVPLYIDVLCSISRVTFYFSYLYRSWSLLSISKMKGEFYSSICPASANPVAKPDIKNTIKSCSYNAKS